MSAGTSSHVEIDTPSRPTLMSTFSETSGDLHYYPMRSDQAKLSDCSEKSWLSM